MKNPVSEHRRKQIDDHGLCYLSVLIPIELNERIEKFSFENKITKRKIINEMLEKEFVKAT